MRLTCPHCGTPISAENINIQRMAAVCPGCDRVFQFDPPASKVKRRKVKPPPPVQTDESDGRLRIAFRTNFRLDRDEAFLSTALVSAIFTGLTAITFSRYAIENPNLGIFALVFALVTLSQFYRLGLMLYNKTHIEVDDRQITVSRKPLPSLMTPAQTISLSGVDKIYYEETADSRNKAYDTPRYHVWAGRVDGNRRLIVTDVLEDYAAFLSQRLNAFLELDTGVDASHLHDDADETADDIITDEFVSPSKASRSGR